MGLVGLCFVALLPLECAGFGQPMADPAHSPEAVGAGPGLTNTPIEAQLVSGPDSEDRGGSNNPSHDTR